MDIEPTTGSVIERIAPISHQIWDAKYRLKAAGGVPIDLTIEDTWRRVAHALAEYEREPRRWEPLFYQALENFRFLPAGRICPEPAAIDALRCSIALSWATSATISEVSSPISAWLR